jgi:uncharacterized membrane protein YphA (DoxX/SURF4 family)
MDYQTNDGSANAYARIAASVMFLHLIPVTVLLHDFMSTQFEKNFGIMGGLLMIAAYGPGWISLSSLLRSSHVRV